MELHKCDFPSYVVKMQTFIELVFDALCMLGTLQIHSQNI